MDPLSSAIKERYGSIATKLTQPTGNCSSSCCQSLDLGSGRDPITRDLYSDSESAGLPKNAVQASLGCGNPVALAKILPGETVLDLGSGGGIDCLLSAKRVGPSGKVYGLDMTESMIELAKRNIADAGITNIEFIHGTMESIPLPDDSVDVVISNCVINLALDKDIVLREIYRVLKKGGKFSVSDIVAKKQFPEEVKKSMEMWTGCVAGALLEEEYLTKLKEAGFSDASIEEVKVYTELDIEELASSDNACCSTSKTKFSKDVISAMAGNVMSAFVRAIK